MKKKFKKAYLEIVNYCNLSCSFCPKTRRKKRMLSLKEAQQVIPQIKTQTDYLYLHVMGEPLLHPQLRQILQICGGENIKVVITTNGLLIPDWEPVLLNEEAVYKVQISLHSFEANERSVSLEEYLTRICAFAKKASQTNRLLVVLRLWNEDQGDLLGQNQLNKQILRIVTREFDWNFSDLEGEDGLKPGKDFKLAPRVFLQSAHKFLWPDSEGEELGSEAFCYGLRDQFGILSDGTVIPCCLDHEGEIALGNVWETPLEDILSGERALALYDGFSKRQAVHPLCRTCGFVRRFDKKG